MAKKNKLMLTLPVGELIWPKLQEPDYKFNQEFGTYSTELRIPSSVASEIIGRLEAFAASELELAEKNADPVQLRAWKDSPFHGHTKMPVKDPAFDVEKDDAGNREIKEVPGYVDLKITTKGGGKRKDGGVYSLKPMVFKYGRDTSGAVVKEPVDQPIFGGSTAQIGVQVTSYGGPGTSIAFGVTIRPVAVCVHEIKERDLSNSFDFEPTAVTGDAELDMPVGAVSGSELEGVDL